MGTICIMLGIITIILLGGAGIFTAIAIIPGIEASINELFTMPLMGQTLGSFIGMTDNVSFNSTGLKIAVIAIPLVIGLFLGLNLIMNGLIYNKTLSIKKAIKSHKK